MSTSIGDALPPYVAQLLDGSDLEAKVGSTFILLTTDDDGAPRPCMLSAGEVFAAGARWLRVGVWAGSGTSSNLRSGRSVLLMIADSRGVVYVRGRARALTAPPGAPLDCFEVPVDCVETDSHEGMPLTSGIRFEVTAGIDSVLAEWKEQLHTIKSATP